ncbi:MAG: sigma-54-dependent Fis family transcriptional regulator, partial [Bdellovibrionales bacterium]|nr:sigma-54-dependent Fis family transcriptional regulator [Bdellovibrionales bacterium]
TSTEPCSLQKKYLFDNIVGKSPEILHVLDLIERVADSDSTVLITGESGTGKELVAKAIHFNSSRSRKPFIPINCGAIPAELLESELFGHVKGAFTGAIAHRTGRFEMADGGTLFLDEIGDMSPNLQVKLLRVLQERCFESVGGTKTIYTNVRVLAATNAHLEKAVKEGKFREDLYYRLNVIPIKVPPLRERISDIPILFHHFMDKFNRTRSKKLTGIATEALDCLYRHDWPGNIRELENLVERLSILKGEGLVDIEDLPSKYQEHRPSELRSTPTFEMPESGMDFNSAVDNFENALILQALQKTGWNRNQAAILLKLNRTTLVEKIKKKGLTPPLENTI